MISKHPTPQAISALLRKAAYDRSETISRATLNHRCTAGFHVRGDKTAVYVGWRPATPLVTPSAAQAERDKARALELAGEYVQVIKAAGWPAEVIHLAGPLVRVNPKQELEPGDPIPPEQTGGMQGFVVSECGHRVAGSEWRAGFRNCERCGG